MDFSKALSNAREHTAIVQRMEFALREDPSNEKLALGLGSAIRRANRSQEQLEAFAETQQIDLVRYRLLRDSELYAVEAVAESVQSFQRSFTGAADYLESGPKNKGRFSEEVEERTRLNLAYTFPGSMGLVLSVENHRNLFGEGQLDEVVNVFGQFLSVSDEDTAIDASRELGAGLITQLCRWVDTNAKWETDIDFVIKHGSGIQKGEYITKNKFFDLHDIFHAAKDEEPNIFSMNGILVGLDIDLRRFHFVVPEGQDIRGVLSDEFITTPTIVGRRYNAIILEKIVRSVATGKETQTYSLVSLSEDLS